MSWLRMRPESPSELEQVDWRGKWIGDDDIDEDDGDGEHGHGRGKMERFDMDSVS